MGSTSSRVPPFGLSLSILQGPFDFKVFWNEWKWDWKEVWITTFGTKRTFGLRIAKLFREHMLATLSNKAGLWFHNPLTIYPWTQGKVNFQTVANFVEFLVHLYHWWEILDQKFYECFNCRFSVLVLRGRGCNCRPSTWPLPGKTSLFPLLSQRIIRFSILVLRG